VQPILGKGPNEVARLAPTSASESLGGFVERVTFHNLENVFCVLRVKARGHRERRKVLGYRVSLTRPNLQKSFRPSACRPSRHHILEPRGGPEKMRARAVGGYSDRSAVAIPRNG
jgi:hypothetical protein